MRSRTLARAVGTSFRMAFAADRRRAFALTAIAVAQVNSTVIAGVLLKVTVVGAAAGHHRTVLVGALLFGLDAAALFALSLGRSRITSVLNDRTAAHFDATTMALTGQVNGIEHYETPEYLDRLEIIRHQPTGLAQSFSVLVNSMALVLQGVVVVGLLISLHPVLAVLPVLALPGFWAMRIGNRIAASSFDETAERRRVAERLFESATDLGAAAEIRLSKLDGELCRRHDAAWASLNRTIQRAEFTASAVQGGGRLLFFGGYLGAVALVVARGLAGSASPGDVLLTVVVAGIVNQQIWSILDVIRRSTFVMVVMRRYGWLVDFARTHAQPSGATVPPPARLSDGIRLCGVSFRYPGNETDTLHDVDLHLPAGSVVALVGENGAGKTTIVKLLTGMYQPTSGEIRLDGTPLVAVDVAAWRSRITAAFQDFCRLEFTLRSSVGVGDLRLVDDAGAVLAALERSGGDSLVRTLDHGLETPLGESFTDGTQLSGGQWQKVALGRAMMRPEPLLLVLDEPAASLDPEAEHELFERHARLTRLTAGRTGGITLLVSHRFTSVRAADLVVVLDGGRVVETGTHSDLLRRGGPYADWFLTQARAYG